MPWPVADLAAYLEGWWRIERRIADRRSGILGRLAGAACFIPAPGGLRYRERGWLRFGAHHGLATSGQWFATGGATAHVCFADGRPFHPLDLSSGVAVVGHACAPDDYSGRYRVGGAGHWSTVWLVRGPRKHLCIATRYTRRKGRQAPL